MSESSSTVLVANRGEIALRILRTADEMGYRTVAVYAADDRDSPHVAAATTAAELPGVGVAAYLDGDAIVAAAVAGGADLVHPGYGFLSEDAAFAARCADAGLVFVGPEPDVLRTFGDKAAARDAAVDAGLPVLEASASGVTVEDVAEFLASHPDGIMLKAVAGGGGRGIRPVRAAEEIATAFRECGAEALAAFGDGDLYVERMLPRARHIEVQVVGAADTDGRRRSVALGDRDCSVQRRRQKMIETAPAQGLSDRLRDDLHSAATQLCARSGLRGLATVEFLVSDDTFVFLEVNPRIQVEHTVTEAVTGLDLVELSLRIARGAGADDLSLPDAVSTVGSETSGAVIATSGHAMQLRVNAETTDGTGITHPSIGALTVFSPPAGPGVRVDTYGVAGLRIGPRYDSLLAKVVVHTRAAQPDALRRKADAALSDFVVEGVRTNIGLLRNVLLHKQFADGPVTTDFVDRAIAELVEPSEVVSPVGAQASDAHGVLAPGERLITAGVTGVVVDIAAAGSDVGARAPLALLEAMKMHHEVAIGDRASVERVLVDVGDAVGVGDGLLIIRSHDGAPHEAAEATADPDRIRPDLAEVLDRQAMTGDQARPHAVDRRHAQGRRTARENVADLIDEGSFVEYGSLALAAQRSRRSEQDLIENTPADGLIAGLGTMFEATGDPMQIAVLSYDYTVLAGTQGMRNHAKTDRLLAIAARKGVPLVLFAEGGGGRPGDTDANGATGLELNTFRAMAALRGRVPTVSIVSGRCFAGNAALAGACDVLIATRDANIGMGGPAMIEGGGLGRYRSEQIGPIDVQTRNGVVDIVAEDDADAVARARQYLSYFSGDTEDWVAPDVRSARHVVPENRLRAYDVRAAIDAVADVDSVLELRSAYGVGVVTALARVEGVAYGVLANSSLHLGGAIDAESADKAVDFLIFCEEQRLPVIILCDTPGFMVGPESEEEATVRRFGRLFVAGARLTVPFGMIILRKAYGLGAMAMGGGSFHAPEFTIAWPTGEIGPMGLEGAVRLGFRKELEAAGEGERDALFAQLVAAAYEQGKALHAATAFELDDVIDPADTRTRIRHLAGLR